MHIGTVAYCVGGAGFAAGEAYVNPFYSSFAVWPHPTAAQPPRPGCTLAILQANTFNVYLLHTYQYMYLSASKQA